MPQDKQSADKLKVLANELFGKKDFKGAYQKYSEAIKADGTNAIYYANRAAASLAMQQFMNACTDADKSISLDPLYVKGYARLAAGRAGLCSWGPAAVAWRKALALLPEAESKLTPTERKMKEQFRAELEKAEAKSKLTNGNTAVGVGAAEVSRTPWHRVMAEESKLDAEGDFNCSGWVMFYAYRDFSEAVTTMKNLRFVTIQGRTAVIGKPDALINFSNAIMRDSRVLHADCPDWFEKYNEQAKFEAERFNAWTNVGPKFIMEDAPKRLRKDGWDSLRRAISTTVRAWIMSGLFASKVRGNLAAAYEFFSRTIELLEWGLHLWHDVPTETKGIVFERTFIRGVKRLKLETMLERLGSKEVCPYTKKQMAEKALEIIADIDGHPPQGQFDPGFVLSFWVYPKAEAFAALGWYHMQIGFTSSTAESAKAEFTEAHLHYNHASTILPPDDEMAFNYLFVALEALWWSGASVKEQLLLFSRLDNAGQKMMRFWEMCQSSEDRQNQLRILSKYSIRIMRGLSSGEYTSDSIVKPKDIKSRDKWADSSVSYI